MNASHSTTPSTKVITFPVIPKASSSTEIPIMKGISILTVDFATLIATIDAVSPRITSTFIILLPTTFPMVISALPFIAEEMLTAASGALVPIATIVRPMISWGIPSLEAIPAAPSTNQSAPLISITKPNTNKPNCNKISIFPPFRPMGQNIGSISLFHSSVQCHKKSEFLLHQKKCNKSLATWSHTGLLLIVLTICKHAISARRLLPFVMSSS